MDDLIEPIFGLFMRKNYNSFLDHVPLNGNEKILEFGCGGGLLTRHIVKRLKSQGHVTAIDISQHWLEKAKRRIKNRKKVTFFLKDIKEEPLDENYYDCVLIHTVLHDITKNDRKDYISLLSHALKRGGKLVIKEPTKLTHGMPESEIRDLMNSAGLEKVFSQNFKSRLIGDGFMAVYKKSIEN